MNPFIHSRDNNRHRLPWDKRASDHLLKWGNCNTQTTIHEWSAEQSIRRVQWAGPQNNPIGQSSGGPMAGQGEQQVPSKMESYMQTANQFLNTAQQFAPVVQQFAPMVQNLPAMWRLYKGFQSLPVAGAASLPASG